MNIQRFFTHSNESECNHMQAEWRMNVVACFSLEGEFVSSHLTPSREIYSDQRLIHVNATSNQTNDVIVLDCKMQGC